MPVSLISKPADHAGFVPLWFVDAHEVGGHIVHSTIRNLEGEVRKLVTQRVKEEFKSGRAKIGSGYVEIKEKGGFLRRGKRKLKVDAFMAGLWNGWTHELLSDAAGILNLGPMYINGMIAYLAAREQDGRLKSVAFAENGAGFGSHPVQVVRVLFACAMLEKLDFADKDAYARELKTRLVSACGSSLPKTVKWLDSEEQEKVTLSLSEVEKIIPPVVETILNSKLDSLQNRALTEVLTWGNKDEALVREMSTYLYGTTKAPDSFEARHVVSASWLALEASAKAGDIKSGARSIHRRALTLLEELYEDQCLLCTMPKYSPTRRKDLRTLAKLASLVKLHQPSN